MVKNFKLLIPDVSGKGGVYKSWIESVNKQDALCLDDVLAVVAYFFSN
jgi:hypothetical protein